jgi:hypothetical protein
MCQHRASFRSGIAICVGSLSIGIECAGYGSDELAIIAVGLAVQLVQHICHCHSTSVTISRERRYEKGAQLIVGKGAAALELRNCREAECQTKMPIRRVQLECGVGEG